MSRIGGGPLLPTQIAPTGGAGAVQGAGTEGQTAQGTSGGAFEAHQSMEKLIGTGEKTQGLHKKEKNALQGGLKEKAAQSKGTGKSGKKVSVLGVQIKQVADTKNAKGTKQAKGGKGGKETGGEGKASKGGKAQTLQGGRQRPRTRKGAAKGYMKARQNAQAGGAKGKGTLGEKGGKNLKMQGKASQGKVSQGSAGAEKGSALAQTPTKGKAAGASTKGAFSMGEAGGASANAKADGTLLAKGEQTKAGATETSATGKGVASSDSALTSGKEAKGTSKAEAKGGELNTGKAAGDLKASDLSKPGNLRVGGQAKAEGEVTKTTQGTEAGKITEAGKEGAKEGLASQQKGAEGQKPFQRASNLSLKHMLMNSVDKQEQAKSTENPRQEMRALVRKVATTNEAAILQNAQAMMVNDVAAVAWRIASLVQQGQMPHAQMIGMLKKILNKKGGRKLIDKIKDFLVKKKAVASGISTDQLELIAAMVATYLAQGGDMDAEALVEDVLGAPSRSFSLPEGGGEHHEEGRQQQREEERKKGEGLKEV